MKLLRDVPYFVWLAYCLVAFVRRDLASPLSVLAASGVGAALLWQAYGRARTPGGGPVPALKLPARPWSRQTWCAVVALSLFLGVQVLDLLTGKLYSAFGILIGLNSAVGLLLFCLKSGLRGAQV